MITMVITSNQVIRPSHDRGFQHRCKWMLWPVHHAVISLHLHLTIIIILLSSSIMQNNHDNLHHIYIVAAQTWLLQVCQLGLHLVQHTCVHHAEGKSNEFQLLPKKGWQVFCNFSFHFCFHFYPSLAENRREFTICIWLPEQRPHIWSGKYLQQSK